jgi:diamine N-acetyltransferase
LILPIQEKEEILPKKDSPQVALKEITEDTLLSIIKLKVSEGQSSCVASNAVSIAEAYFSEEAWFRAINVNEVPVGFVMLYLDQDKPEYYLWRFMIDKDHQGKGYGRQAMELVVNHVRGLPGAKGLLLSYVPGKGNPARFYKKLGFEDTGEWDEGEKIMKLPLEKKQ